MADENPAQNLCDETTCSICLEYFRDPVIIDCGHIFCQTCITQCWEEPGRNASCPQCREPCQQRNFRPIRQLASIVEIAKKFSLQVAKGTEGRGRACEKHQEPLKLFCEDDRVPICVVCDKAKEHRNHHVVPAEEAFQECKSKIHSHLEVLKEEREAILSSKLHVETERQKLVEQAETVRQNIIAKFKQLHQFLEKQEHFLLAELKELDDSIKCFDKRDIAKLSEELSSLDNLIKEMEEKLKQPANEFLQDIKSSLQRCDRKNIKHSIVFPHPLKQQVATFSETEFQHLNTVIKGFVDTLFPGQQEKKDGAVLVPHFRQKATSGAFSLQRCQRKMLWSSRGQSNAKATGVNQEEKCAICMDKIQQKEVLSKCQHEFCRQCIQMAMKYKPVCPVCNVFYGKIEGDQPPGSMEVTTFQDSLPGYEGYGTLSITYNIKDGIQTSDHPNPGKRFFGTSQIAYLPGNREGREILQLLQQAFDQKLIFTVSPSCTTAMTDAVIWNGIDHKTNLLGGPENNGYPDPHYLKHVRDQLRAKGIE